MTTKWISFIILAGVFALGGTVNAQNNVIVAKEAATAFRKAHEKEILTEFLDLLSIPNHASNNSDIRKNADFIMARMEKSGISTKLLELEGSPPAIYGELLSPGASKTIMVYVHYDGQRVDPSNWETDPFVPTLRSGKMEDGAETLSYRALDGKIDEGWRIYGRSASDDKAPIMTLLSAIDALKEANISTAANLKFFFEGEEELGSPHLKEMLRANKDLLKSDFWLFFDGPQDQRGNPRVVLGVRGSISAQFKVYGPSSGLHSGHYGNFAPNPISRIVNLLASMRNDDGRILIDGFYDDVEKPSEAMLDLIKAIPDADMDIMNAIDVGGREHNGMRYEEALLWPALNYQGFNAGGVGNKARNVIEPMAQASVGVRLVPGQTREGVIKRIEDHVQGQGYFIIRDTPSAEVKEAHEKVIQINWGLSGYEAMRTSPEHPMAQELISIMGKATDGEALTYPLLGGSLPLIHIKRELGTPLIVIPIANHDNSQHAPNENIRIGHLWQAIEIYASIFANFGANKIMIN